MELLFSKGAQVNSRNDVGQTPLHMAVLGNSTGATEFLIQNGANVRGRDKCGITPFQVAEDSGYIEIIDIFLKHSARE